MALSVCLLLDERSDRAVRLLWERLEHDGIRTLLTHTHGRHRPHLTLASLLAYDLDETRSTLAGVGLAPLSPMRLRLEGLGMFRRSRCWLAPVACEPLLGLQCEVAGAVGRTDAVLHRNYEPGAWTPHLTLAPRLHLDELPTVARHAFEVLPIDAVLERAVLIDTSTGAVHQIPPALR